MSLLAIAGKSTAMESLFVGFPYEAVARITHGLGNVEWGGGKGAEAGSKGVHA